MASWSRREVLAALAAAGTAPGWAALLSCGGTRSPVVSRPVRPAPETVAGLRDQLREIAADLAARFRSVSVRAELGRLTRVLVEPENRAVEQRDRSSLVLAGFDGSSWFERVSSDLSPDAIAATARELASRAARRGAGGETGAGSGPASPVGSRRMTGSGPASRSRSGTKSASESASESASTSDPGSASVSRARPGSGAGAAGEPRLRIDPRERPAGDWIARAARLHDRATRVGGSRIVYRVTSVDVDDGDILFIGDGRELTQRLTRTRARVLFLAWTGSALAAEEAAAGGAIGLEATELAGGALARAAEGALTLLTSGQVVAGERDLLLDPSVAALLVRHGAVRGFEADVWARGGGARALEGRAGAAPIITLRDDPTADAAYGGYRFDDEGWPAAPLALIEHGIVRGPLCDAAAAAALGRPRTGHGRRGGPLDPIEPRPSHLVLEPGTRADDELVGSIEDQGFLIEGGVDASGDPETWRVAVRARRAREIARGRLTGRVYGPVVVAGQVPALLGAVRGLGREPELHAWREPRRSGELATSVAVPALVTRGWLGGA